MARTTTIIPRLNAGELSPWLEGGVDFAQYGKGLSKCQNLIPLVQGPLTKRPATKFVAEVKTSSKTVNILPFIFADDDAYILEFGDHYIRFYTDRAQLLSGGSPYEIVSPYAEADLPLLRFTQSGDVVYLAHALYAPRKLSRLAATNWTVTTVNFTNGPIGVENTSTTNITSSAVTGTVTLTASAALFTVGMVGSFIKLRHANNGTIPAWEAGKAATSGATVVHYDGNFYVADNSATTGGDPPIHLEGKVIDGFTGVNWTYLHSGFGIAKIVAFSTSTSVTAAVTVRIPANVVSANTTFWSLGDWSADRGFPGAVAFFGDRLFWGGSTTQPQTVWGSVVGDYENHKPGTLNDSALSLTISSSDVSTIRWLEEDEKGLLAGTTRGEWVIRPSSDNEALTPFNANALRLTNFGSNFVAPKRAEKAIMFVQAASRKLREMAYTLNVDGFSAPDMTVRAEHITSSGMTSLTYQAQPNPTLWGPLANGQLVGMTYERDQEVLAWHHHVIGGSSTSNTAGIAVVEDVAVIPSPNGDKDDVWLVVERVINGATKRYVEYITPIFDHDTPADQAMFSDSVATYSGVPATIISGLGHLEGETVKVLVDGATHPDLVVSSGQITLDSPAEEVHVGLGYSAIGVLERLEVLSTTESTVQAQNKRITKVGFRMYRSGPMKYGHREDTLAELEYRNTDDLMDTAVPLFTEDVSVNWNAPWGTDGRIVFVSDTPTPLTILAVIPTLETVKE